MDISTKYQLLTRLPLMQGVSGKELAQLESSIGLEVEELGAMRQPIIRQGEHCTHLIFLVGGSVLRHHTSADGQYTTLSCLMAPCVLEPQRLYGLHCQYQYTYTLQHDAAIISIPKRDVGHTLMKGEIFRMNMLNMLCAINQKKEMQLQPSPSASLHQKLLALLRRLFADATGQAELHIKMTTLASYLGETRLNTSRELNLLQEQGLLSLHRATISLPDVEKITLNTAL